MLYIRPVNFKNISLKGELNYVWELVNGDNFVGYLEYIR